MVVQEFLILCSVLILTVLLYFRYSKSQIRQNAKTDTSSTVLKTLPGPINFPIIGSLIQIGLTAGTGASCVRYHKMCQRYGRFMGAKIGKFKLAVVEDYAVAREILYSPDWSSRFPIADHYRTHTFGKNLGLIFSHRENWKEMRRFVIRTLREFGFGELNIAEQYLNEELTCFIKYFDELRLQSNNVLKMNGLFKIPLVNIIWRIVMGVRLEYGDEEALKIVHLVEKASEDEFGIHPFFAFPWIRHIPISGFNPVGNFKQAFGEIHTYLRKILNARRAAGVAGVQNQTNFMDRLIQKAEEEKNNPGTIYTDEQLLCVLADILAASLDTTSNSFEFAFLYMIKYYEVQKKVQAELDSVIGRSRVPDVFDRSKLPYTEATMLESLRHANAIPIAPRTSTCDTVVNGYFIPKDTFCMLNLTAIHMDEEIWDDPRSFRPERFLDTNNNNKVLRDNKLLAFGAGKRQCIGHTMSKVTWMAFFATVLQKYSFEVSKEHPENSTEPISGFTNTAQNFYCQVKLR